MLIVAEQAATRAQPDEAERLLALLALLARSGAQFPVLSRLRGSVAPRRTSQAVQQASKPDAAAAARWRFESTGPTSSTSRTPTFRLPKG